MAGKGSAKGEHRGGRKAGTPNVLPDLRAMTIKALIQAGGVDYLARQAEENPAPFLGLLGRVIPREIHTELTADVRIRQEVRKDLVEKLLVLLTVQATGGAIAHEPALMLSAQQSSGRDELSRRAENARKEAIGAVSGAVHRAAHAQLPQAKPSSEAA